MKGEIPDQQTQLAKELELDGIGKKLARAESAIGIAETFLPASK